MSSTLDPTAGTTQQQILTGNTALLTFLQEQGPVPAPQRLWLTTKPLCIAQRKLGWVTTLEGERRAETCGIPTSKRRTTYGEDVRFDIGQNARLGF